MERVNNMEKDEITELTFHANSLINLLIDCPEDVIDYVLDAVTNNCYVFDDEINEILEQDTDSEGGVE